MPSRPFVNDDNDVYTSCEDTEPHALHVLSGGIMGREICIGRSGTIPQWELDLLNRRRNYSTSETRTTSSTGGEKGVKDARFDLIPIGPLTQLARLYGRGAEKYDSHNWRRGYEWSKSYAAMMRHATQFWGGENIDEEMDLPHLTAVIFHAMALLEFMENHQQFDDRYSDPKESEPEDLPDELPYLGDLK